MFTRSTLTAVAVAGILSGCASHTGGVASISSVDDRPQNAAADRAVVQAAPATSASAETPTAAANTANTQGAVTAAESVNVPPQGGGLQNISVNEANAQATTNTSGVQAAADTASATSTAASQEATANTATSGTQTAASSGSTSVQTSNGSADVQTSTGAGVQAASSTAQTSAEATATAQNAPADVANTTTTVQNAPANPATVPASGATAATATPQVAEQPAAVTAQVDVYHAPSRTDDGSAIVVTVDGKEAGTLTRGQVTSLSVSPGKHKLGGYVRTLFGLGRVTIPAVDITTTPTAVTKISYKVTKNKPGFTVAKA